MDFDKKFYAAVYPDVSLDSALAHWTNIGQRSGRFGSREHFYGSNPLFRWHDYVKQHPECRNHSVESWELMAIRWFVDKYTSIEHHDEDNINLYQIYYSDMHLPYLISGLKSFKNNGTCTGFESTVMCDIQKAGGFDKQWGGVFSWRINNKLNGPEITFKHIQEQIILNKDQDILAISCDRYWHADLCVKHKASTNWAHIKAFTGLLALLNEMKIRDIITDEIPVSLDDSIHRVYCNYFIAKKHIMHDFVDNFLQPGLNLLLNCDDLKEVALADSGYTEPVPVHFSRATGINYWPLVPFILERMINAYIVIKQPKISFCL